MINLHIPKIIIKNFYFFFARHKNHQKDRIFYKNKKVTKIDDIDFIKILVSKEEPCGTKSSFKYFIGYNEMMLLDHYE